MSYKGIVYVFDFDDTLMWCGNWYDEAVLDKEGYVLGPGKSPALKAASELLSKKQFRLRIEYSKQLDGHNYFFKVISDEGKPQTIESLGEFFSLTELNDSHIVGNSRYSKYAAVICDFLYYQNLDTVGVLGFNEDIIPIYKANHENAAILTARGDVPGMKEAILDAIAPVAEPLELFVQPLESTDSGRYKGRILCDIAKSDEVEYVYFYDDNLKYIQNAQKVIDERGLTHKITLKHVSKRKKPSASKLKDIEGLVDIANNLDRQMMHKHADAIDSVMKIIMEKGR